MGFKKRNTTLEFGLHVFYESLWPVSQRLSSLFIEKWTSRLTAEAHHPFQFFFIKVAPAKCESIGWLAPPSGFDDDYAQLGRFEGVGERAVRSYPAALELAAR